MATIESCSYSFDRILGARAFRHARCYAPEAVMRVLRDVVGAPELVLLIDVDTLERSTLARIDRVMLLALDALVYAGAQVVLVAHHARDRAAVLQRAITASQLRESRSVLGKLREERPQARVIAISDDPDLLRALTPDDRGIALGRPELSGPHVASAGDANVRATLWWLLEERVRTAGD